MTVVAILLLTGCSNVTKADIVEKMGDGSGTVIENIDTSYTSSTLKDPVIISRHTGVPYESYMDIFERYIVTPIGEETIIDNVSITVDSYKIIDNINDISKYYPEYGDELVEVIKNKVNADKQIDPETGNYYQNRAWNERGNTYIDYEIRNQVLAIEYRVKPLLNIQRDLFMLFGLVSKHDDKYITVVGDNIRQYSNDIEIDYMDANQLYFRLERNKEYKFVHFYKVTTAYGLEYYKDFYININYMGYNRAKSKELFLIQLW